MTAPLQDLGAALALQKSYELLLENLNPGQRSTFQNSGYFDARSRGEDYRFKKDITERIRDGERYCLIFPGLPIYDQMLGRKLFLETWPEEFFKVANIFPPHRDLTAQAWDRAILAEYARRSPFIRAWHSESERAHRLIADLIAQRARYLNLDPAHFSIRLWEIDFCHAIEVEVSHLSGARRNFRFETDHLRAENLEAFLRELVAEVITHICEEVQSNANSRRPLQCENHEERQESATRVQERQSRRGEEYFDWCDPRTGRAHRRPWEWEP